MKYAPFTVYLSTNSSVCSGVILDNTTILTAAHCLAGRTKADDIFVILGVPSKKQFSLDKKMRVKSFVIHPQYEDTALLNDLAIVKLAQPIAFNLKQDKISVYYDDVDAGVDAFVTGWGLNPDGMLSQTVRTLQVTVFPDIACTKKFGNDFKGVRQICAGSTNQDFCVGDSGGPLIIMQKGVPYLIGIVSYTGEQCSDGRPSVYTKMKTYRSFIEKYLD